MITIDKSIFINRPLQEVFEFMSNPVNDAQWQSSTDSAEWTSEGPPRVGSTIRQVGRFMGRDTSGTGEVTSWDPPNGFGVKSLSGPFPFESTTKFESNEDGTKLTISAQAEVGGFFKIAEGLVTRQAEKQFDADLESLKTLLEEGQS
jgi:carbon monoxide dehydrogenase subunit G